MGLMEDGTKDAACRMKPCSIRRSPRRGLAACEMVWSRGWHHVALCIAAYGFLIAEKAAFPSSAETARPVQAP